MICLALECSTSRRSVAVARDGVTLAEAAHSAGRDTPLFGLIADVLARADLRVSDVACIAVGLGPGSYTGVRIAIAACQGWDVAQPLRLLGIPSVDATAHRAAQLGRRGRTAVITDAHRGEFYVAEFDLGPEGATPRSALRIATRPEIEALRAAGVPCVGPDLEPLALGISADPVFPDASALAALAQGRTDFVSAEALEPVYLRLPTFVKAPAGRTLAHPD
ncbi:MAG: tRNA (adenosine(37)-N6)-threonylcarbamoyltransferase complex dimerization subunit type 1 TsaB [Limisphaerales bacterium]